MSHYSHSYSSNVPLSLSQIHRFEFSLIFFLIIISRARVLLAQKAGADILLNMLKVREIRGVRANEEIVSIAIDKI